jgi:non-specific serine/threonine protein kinase
MSLPDAVELAKAVAAGRSGMTPTPVSAGQFPLTRRERQVATLIVAGRTNRQISRALGIAEKTVEVHVHNAMAKLDVSNRAEVAAWAVVNGLVPPQDQP